MEIERLTIAQLLELAHKHKALHIKAGPLEITLHPSAFESVPGEPSELDSEPMPPPEDLMFAAGAQFVKDADAS